MEVTKLQETVTKMTTEQQNQAKAIPVEILKKIFTSGQIAKLRSSTNSHINLVAR